jgi:hypothetical protein
MVLEEEVGVGIATGTDCLCMVAVVEGDGWWAGGTSGSKTSMDKMRRRLSNRHHSAGWMMVVKMFL